MRRLVNSKQSSSAMPGMGVDGTLRSLLIPLLIHARGLPEQCRHEQCRQCCIEHDRGCRGRSTRRSAASAFENPHTRARVGRVANMQPARKAVNPSKARVPERSLERAARGSYTRKTGFVIVSNEGGEREREKERERERGEERRVERERELSTVFKRNRRCGASRIALSLGPSRK
jgi:hypothetical protein